MQIPAWLKLLWQYLLGTYGYALTTPEGSRSLLVGVGTVVALFTVLIWHRGWGFNRVTIAGTSLLIPFSVLLTIYASRGFEGVPDPRCQAYNFGNQKYLLMGYPTIAPADPNNPFGENDLLVLVRSENRWEGAVHTCILPMKDPKAKQLMAQLKELMLRARMSEAGVGGGAYFTFGSPLELPNITVKIPPDSEEEKGQPDIPNGGRRA
jgi:hypothetical protein